MKWLLIGFLLAALAAKGYSEDCESCHCCTTTTTNTEDTEITITESTTTKGTTTESTLPESTTTVHTTPVCTTTVHTTTESTLPESTTSESTTTESSTSSEEEEEDRFPLAENCDVEACQLPDCRCSSTNIPGGLAPRNTPQLVTLTFDDGINIENIVTYRNLLLGRTNTNGCPATATFFINHEYTNYQLVNELYNSGHEIALHSISHQLPHSYWAEGTYEDMRREFADQITQMNHFANIPISQIKGIRMPFLQLAGNSSFKVMSDYNLVYDLTWPTLNFQQPGLWPYTLDYASTQDCVIPPCPTASVPGVWVHPIIPWIDLNGLPCSMVDSCAIVPNVNDEDGWFRFIVSNFERHYMGNRAPFGFYVHEWFIRNNQAIYRALERFLNMVNRLEDAFMVRADEVIEWVKNPVTVDEYKQQSCNPRGPPTICLANSCGPLFAEHNNNLYWMQICGSCPRVYPWLGNPLGQ